MLTDVHFSLEAMKRRNAMKHEYCTYFSYKDGILHTKWHIPDPRGCSIDRVEAIRVAKGVYESYQLNHLINAYTDLQAVHTYEDKYRLHSLINKLDHKDPRWRRLADWSLRHVNLNEYGSADTLKQIFQRCRHYTRSPVPYVLEIHRFTPQDSPDWRWHKNGEYIGDIPQEKLGERLGDTPWIEQIISFHWYRLVPFGLKQRPYK